MLNTHIIRLGTHAEKDYLLRAYAWFDDVLLNANLVQGTATSIGAFLIELSSKGKGYFIDPMAYAFALSPHLLMKRNSQQTCRANLKRTFEGLAQSYGTVIEQCAGERVLQPSDFANKAVKEEFCHRVLNYQRDKLNEALRDSEGFLSTEPQPLEPTRLVAPYFQLSGDLDWLELNINFANISHAYNTNAWAVVCLDSLLLDSEELGQIMTAYKDLSTTGYLLWATDFSEEHPTAGQIRGLRRLVTQLSRNGTKPVINLFGGYFSCLLAEDGLTGISHGLGYGERRDIEPVLGGGLPPAKYYLPPIHQHIRIDQLVSIARRLNDSTFVNEVCDCVICQGLLRQGIGFLINQYSATENRLSEGRRQVATPQAYKLTRFHYLCNKHLEFQRCHRTTRSELINQLDIAYVHFRDRLGASSLTYLRNWSRILNE